MHGVGIVWSEDEIAGAFVEGFEVADDVEREDGADADGGEDGVFRGCLDEAQCVQVIERALAGEAKEIRLRSAAAGEETEEEFSGRDAWGDGIAVGGKGAAEEQFRGELVEALFVIAGINEETAHTGKHLGGGELDVDGRHRFKG